MGPRRGGTGGGVGVVVPADWWLLPLGDDAGTHRAVAAMVEHRYGRGDELAGLRRQVRVQVLASARRAVASGGRLMGFMLTRVGELPLPATMTAYRLPGSMATPDDVAALRAGLAEHADLTGGRVDAGEGPFGPVLRGVRERAPAAHTPAAHAPADYAPAGAGPAGAERAGGHVLLCDYWTDPQDGEGLVNLSFSTPLVALRDGWVELFDAIAGTLHRLHDDAAAEVQPDEGGDGDADEGEDAVTVAVTAADEEREPA